MEFLFVKRKGQNVPMSDYRIPTEGLGCLIISLWQRIMKTLTLNSYDHRVTTNYTPQNQSLVKQYSTAADSRPFCLYIIIIKNAMYKQNNFLLLSEIIFENNYRDRIFLYFNFPSFEYRPCFTCEFVPCDVLLFVLLSCIKVKYFEFQTTNGKLPMLLINE